MLAIRYCSLSAIVACLPDEPARYSCYSLMAHHLGIGPGGCRLFRIVLYSQIVWSNYSALAGAVICTRLKIAYAICDDDSFDESVDRSFEIYFD